MRAILITTFGLITTFLACSLAARSVAAEEPANRVDVLANSLAAHVGQPIDLVELGTGKRFVRPTACPTSNNDQDRIRPAMPLPIRSSVMLRSSRPMCTRIRLRPDVSARALAIAASNSPSVRTS